VKVPQFEYLSPEAQALRRQDGTKPWEVHACELDSVGEPDAADDSLFARSWRAAAALRAEIEGTA
jgi:hypothetical protein